MRYKLYTDKKYETPLEQILYSRGVEDIEKWLKASMKDVSDWDTLDYIEDGVDLLFKAIQEKNKVCIVVDSDVDGYTSAAILINYLYRVYEDWVKENLIYIHHKGKEHGLADVYKEIPEGVSLVICPDGGTNDYDIHEKLNEQGVSVLILDHHEAPHISKAKNTITINNQLCDYKNKSLSGAGVVWQFCRAFNDILGLEGQIDTDLCALGLCADMMDYRNVETRALVQEGFSDVTNPLFYQMISDNDYIIQKHGGLNYRAVAFAVVPFINATIRSGTQEEKDCIFRAMCLPWAFVKVPFTKRGHKGEEVSSYIEASYKTAAIKRRQTKLEQDALTLLDKKVKEENLLDDKVLMLLCNPGEVEKNIAGLVANKLQAKYQKPTLVLTKTKTMNEKEYSYRGSIRNYSMCEIENFKDVLDGTGLTEYVVGHQGAAGCGVKESNIPALKKKLNDIYQDVSNEAVFWVDYKWTMNEANQETLLELANLCEYWGQDIQPSQVFIEDIDLSQCKKSLCGSKNNVFRMVLPNGLVLVKFGVKEEEFESMLEDNTYLSCVVTPKRNEWQGIVNGEGEIDSFELNTRWFF